MEYKVSSRMANTAPSPIRAAMAKIANIQGCISLGIGNPASEAIPTEQILEAIKDVAAGDPMLILQYGSAMGYMPLIEMATKHMIMDMGCSAEGNMTLLINGSSQGLGLMPQLLCDDGDVVFADEFSYPSGANAASATGAIVKGIAMDKDGMIPEALEEAAKEGNGKYIYLIPNFQNPTGITIPLERRKKLYEIAQKYDLMIYEDDPYGEIRFAGESVPSFKSMDTDGRVVYAASYSKTLSAGLRVGYLFGPTPIMMQMMALKFTTDGQSPLLNQMVAYHALQKVDYKSYIQNICDIYGKKCKIMVDAINKYCAKEFTFVQPEGGMFLWLEAPEEINTLEFFDACLENKVCVIFSGGFATEPEKNAGHAFRLNYTAITEDEIVEAVKRLGKVTHDFIAKLNK